MYVFYAVIVSAAIGLTLRLVWAKAVMKGELYRVPLFWVTIIFVIALATTPKSVALLLGIFSIDLIGSIAKDNQESQQKFSEFLNWLMDKLPIKEAKNEEDTADIS